LKSFDLSLWSEAHSLKLGVDSLGYERSRGDCTSLAPPSPAFSDLKICSQFFKTTMIGSSKQKSWEIFVLAIWFCKQPYCNKNPIYVFLFWELRGLSPNYHIHVSVNDLYIPRMGPHIFLQQNRQTHPGKI
jgi:hypothetical protein